MIIKPPPEYKKFLLEIILITALPVILAEVGLFLAFVFFLFKIFVKFDDEWLLKALFYFFLFRFINPLLLPNSPTLTILSWLILLVVFTRLIFISNLKDYKGLAPFFAFIFIAFLASLFKSEYLTISLLKLFSFLIGFLTVFVALKKTLAYQWEQFFVSVWILLLIVSLPTILIPHIGFARNATGFQGVTNHPQFFGPFCALIGGIATVLFSMKKIPSINRSALGILMLINFSVILMSESRTALLLFSFLILLGVYIYFREKKSSLVKLFPKMVIIGLSVILVGLYNFSTIENKLINFLAKDRTESTSELTFNRFAKSRSQFTDVSLQNFEENPLLGIGFAAPNHFYEFEVEYLANTNIPISASMEKGVLIALLLEEVGTVGFLFFGGFIMSFLIPVFKFNKTYLVFILGPLILNLGEASIFSTNGQGILLWSLFCLAFFRSKYYSKYQQHENYHLAA